MIDDDSEEPSRVGTPAISEDKSDPMTQKQAPPAVNSSGNERNTEGENTGEAVQRPPAELPPDVRAKLRKLEKLESRYQGWYLGHS